MNNKPWRHKWDRKSVKGVIFPELKRFEHERYMKSSSEFKPYERWDLMKHYRETIHDDDAKSIVSDLKKFEFETEDNEREDTMQKVITRARKIPREET